MDLPGVVRGGFLFGVLTLLAACGSQASTGPDIPSTEPTSSPGSSEHGVAVLQLDFDELAEGPLRPGAEVADVSGNDNNGRYVVPAGVAGIPAPLVIAHGSGRALQFREPCDKGPDCLRGILEVPSSAELNPGVSDFTFGLDLRVESEDIRSGGNLLQKGFSTGPGGQWKVQVDEQDGFPSCVLVDSFDNELLDVFSEVSVADGQWHTVVCDRSGSQLSIWVDGRQVGREMTREVLLIDNASPVRIAGKHLKENGDFFFGEVDNVFVTVG